MSDKDQMRAEFEAWAKDKYRHINFSRRADENYFVSAVNYMWSAYQAAFPKQAPVEQEPVALEVRLGEMRESNGRVTWYVHLARVGASLMDCHQVYSSESKGRAEYERDSLLHFLGQGPFPDLLSYDTDLLALPAVQQAREGEVEGSAWYRQVKTAFTEYVCKKVDYANHFEEWSPAQWAEKMAELRPREEEILRLLASPPPISAQGEAAGLHEAARLLRLWLENPLTKAALDTAFTRDAFRIIHGWPDRLEEFAGKSAHHIDTQGEAEDAARSALLVSLEPTLSQSIREMAHAVDDPDWFNSHDRARQQYRLWRDKGFAAIHELYKFDLARSGEASGGSER